MTSLNEKRLHDTWKLVTEPNRIGHKTPHYKTKPKQHTSRDETPKKRMPKVTHARLLLITATKSWTNPLVYLSSMVCVPPPSPLPVTYHILPRPKACKRSPARSIERSGSPLQWSFPLPAWWFCPRYEWTAKSIAENPIFTTNTKGLIDIHNNHDGIDTQKLVVLFQDLRHLASRGEKSNNRKSWVFC